MSVLCDLLCLVSDFNRCVCLNLLYLFSAVACDLSRCVCLRLLPTINRNVDSQLLCLFSVVGSKLAVALAVLAGMSCPFSTVLSIFSGQLRLLSAAVCALCCCVFLQLNVYCLQSAFIPRVSSLRSVLRSQLSIASVLLSVVPTRVCLFLPFC